MSIEEAVLKEEELIRSLDTLVPNGYNVHSGGEYFPHYSPRFGADNANALLTEEEAQYILDNRN